MDKRSLIRAEQFAVGIYLLCLGGMAIVLAYIVATPGSQIGAAKVFIFIVASGAIVALSAGLTVFVLNVLQMARGGTYNTVSSSLALATVGCIVLAWYLADAGTLAAFPVGFLGYVVWPIALAAHVFRIRERFTGSS